MFVGECFGLVGRVGDDVERACGVRAQMGHIVEGERSFNIKRMAARGYRAAIGSSVSAGSPSCDTDVRE